jgi:CDP-diacylglycerol---glycerol-3-phosphate 3-phosphatidyltransferase
MRMNTVECPTRVPSVRPFRLRINLPNQITITRLLLAIVFFICMAQFDARAPKLWLLDVAFVVFVVAGLSDILDGYLARKWHQVTSFGRVIDPFVDKILVIGAYIFMASEVFVDQNGVKISDVSAWMVVVILGRELLVTSLRGVSEAGGKSFGANVYGKAKMALQSITIGWVLVTVAHSNGFLGTAPFTIGRVILLYLTVAVTFLSMIPYVWSARGILSETSAPSP